LQAGLAEHAQPTVDAELLEGLVGLDAHLEIYVSA
jgi:hypothetical protein